MAGHTEYVSELAARAYSSRVELLKVWVAICREIAELVLACGYGVGLTEMEPESGRLRDSEPMLTVEVGGGGKVVVWRGMTARLRWSANDYQYGYWFKRPVKPERLSTKQLSALIAGPLQRISEKLVKYTIEQRDSVDRSRAVGAKIELELLGCQPAPRGYESIAAKTSRLIAYFQAQGDNDSAAVAKGLLQDILGLPPADELGLASIDREAAAGQLDELIATVDALREVGGV